MKMLSLAREVLTKISNKEVLINTVLADIFKISPYYAELILRSLSEDGYIVVNGDGKCEITPKGQKFLNGDNRGT